MTHVYVVNFIDQPTIDAENDDRDMETIETAACPQFYAIHAEWGTKEQNKAIDALLEEASYLLETAPRSRTTVGPWVKPTAGREHQIIDVEIFDEDEKAWSFFGRIVAQKEEVQ